MGISDDDSLENQRFFTDSFGTIESQTQDEKKKEPKNGSVGEATEGIAEKELSRKSG